MQSVSLSFKLHSHGQWKSSFFIYSSYKWSNSCSPTCTPYSALNRQEHGMKCLSAACIVTAWPNRAHVMYIKVISATTEFKTIYSNHVIQTTFLQVSELHKC